MFHVYILRCRDGWIYIGQSKDITQGMTGVEEELLTNAGIVGGMSPSREDRRGAETPRLQLPRGDQPCLVL